MKGRSVIRSVQSESREDRRRLTAVCVIVLVGWCQATASSRARSLIWTSRTGSAPGDGYGGSIVRLE